MRLAILLSALSLSLSATAFGQVARGQGRLTVVTKDVARAVELFRSISDLAAPGDPTAGKVECGYIFPGDSSKFGCKGTGSAEIRDIAAACSGGGSFACTGSGSNRTCTCAFD